MAALYDRIGKGYSSLRQPDPRIADAIRRALGNAMSVINVGAGAGSYEPQDIDLVAVEPSAEMIEQRPMGSASAVQASAEKLPFADEEFDAAMAVLTVHHWPDRTKGLAEMRRVARHRIVIVTFDLSHPANWLDDYLPGLRKLDEKQMPCIQEFSDAFGEISVQPLLIPHDCRDGFLYSYWRRPEAYCDARIRSAISSFSLLPDCDAGLARLERDLASGEWAEKHAELLERQELDCGYRLVVASLD